MSSEEKSSCKRKSFVIEDLSIGSNDNIVGKGKKLKANQRKQIRSVVSKVGPLPKQTKGKESGKNKRIKGKLDKGNENLLTKG